MSSTTLKKSIIWNKDMEYKALRVIISGGGTGGHIFPAISIANKLKELNPDTEILFVGAEGKMEMEKVPAAGYKIVGLPILGLQRQLNLHNIVNDLKVPFKVFQSIREAGRIIDSFKPDIAIGVGGYASAPLLWQATRKGIPSLIQEQNGFAGLTNKIVGRKAGCICVAYEGMERFFPADKIVMSGNPIRSDIVPATAQMVLEGMEYYGLDPQKDHLLIVGGSLGSGTLNKAMKHWIEQGCPGGDNVEIIWQCGKYYKKGIEAFMAGRNLPFIHYTDFIGRMDYAYAVADVVISRSGASTVSELCAAHKASIFVPSPNVAEDHQTHNAMALVNKDAALMVRDAEAPERLMPTALALLRDEARIQQLEANIAKLALTNAAQVIADEAYKLVDVPSISLTENRGYARSTEGTSTNEGAYSLVPASELEGTGTEGDNPKRVYFIGIGGIGMSAIARYYKFKGLEVSGYDRTPSDLTKELEAEGIAIHYEDRPDLVPSEKDGTLVVYTPAIPDDMGELVFVRENGYRLVKRSRVLGEIARGQRCLAVAGTHGKTTTSTLAAHILTASGEGCSAFLGGISKNYNTNLLTSKTPTVVAEADEFDRSFLQLFPEVAVVTAMDPDHLDIYGTEEAYRQAFKDFAAQVSGTLIAKLGLPLTAQDTPAKILHYHYNDPKADFHARNIVPDELGYFSFDLVWPGGVLEGMRTNVPGWLNVENSVAAAALCLTYGLAPEKVREAIASFQGVRRRLDVHVNRPGCTYIDDYAHHPQELATAISSLKEIFPTRKMTAIFQPHLFTRTRDFADDFAQALSGVDKLILLDIYPAREEPIPGVTSDIIFDKVTAPEKVLLKKEELMDYLAHEPVDVLVTFGAGNIDRFIGPITDMLEKRL